MYFWIVIRHLAIICATGLFVIRGMFMLSKCPYDRLWYVWTSVNADNMCLKDVKRPKEETINAAGFNSISVTVGLKCIFISIWPFSSLCFLVELWPFQHSFYSCLTLFTLSNFFFFLTFHDANIYNCYFILLHCINYK